MNAEKTLVIAGLALALAACGASADLAQVNPPEPAASQAFGNGGQAGFELGETARLAIGTLRLEGELAPDAEQAAQLLFLWQAYGGLLESESASSQEVESLAQQVRQAMSAEQLEAIAAMSLTSDEIAALVQPPGEAPGEASGGGFGPGAGLGPPGGGGGGLAGPGGAGGPFPGGEAGLTPEQIATAQANRAQRQEDGDRITSWLLVPLIEHLEALAAN